MNSLPLLVHDLFWDRQQQQRKRRKKQNSTTIYPIVHQEATYSVAVWSAGQINVSICQFCGHLKSCVFAVMNFPVFWIFSHLGSGFTVSLCAKTNTGADGCNRWNLMYWWSRGLCKSLDLLITKTILKTKRCYIFFLALLVVSFIILWAVDVKAFAVLSQLWQVKIILLPTLQFLCHWQRRQLPAVAFLSINAHMCGIIHRWYATCHLMIWFDLRVFMFWFVRYNNYSRYFGFARY